MAHIDFIKTELQQVSYNKTELQQGNSYRLVRIYKDRTATGTLLWVNYNMKRQNCIRYTTMAQIDFIKT